MHNPVAGELGITTQQELDDFVENSLPKFKLVTDSSRSEQRKNILTKPLRRRKYATRALAFAQF